MKTNGQVDVVILNALQLEYQAVIKYLDDGEPARTKSWSHYRGKIGPYEIVVAPIFGMGNVRAAVATTEAIAIWNPRYIIMTGIAGGVKKKNERYLGDVLVADQIIDYEMGKAKPNGEIERRYQVYRPAKSLIDSAKNLRPENWVFGIDIGRPDKTTGRVIPQVHFGSIGSGQKVVTDEELVEDLKVTWAELIGLEMEGVGVALATYVSDETPGFLLIKGVCDWADPEKNDDWQAYAAEASATFTAAVLRSQPFVSKQREQLAPEKASTTSLVTVKREICSRLISDWEDVADVLGIPQDARAKFKHGRGPHGVWEWLEDRGKLQDLKAALEAIDRGDLVKVLDENP